LSLNLLMSLEVLMPTGFRAPCPLAARRLGFARPGMPTGNIKQLISKLEVN